MLHSRRMEISNLPSALRIGFGSKWFAEDDLPDQRMDLVAVGCSRLGDLIDGDLIGRAELAGEGEGEEVAGEGAREAGPARRGSRP